ncbi:DNA replication and repair protein RecF [Desulfofundulus luciae]|uniref:DNA replication and repair protein RecF n=1 Tax=Desulfofundulus luciae TaxID=74702 RepID=A0ABU0AWQ5_9FIRM|nr:DNA replication/repair protein RecF [Desulfofundulus luciae]MDQ0284914.1 DNA replication and repair protein RecF [Desulfofundulus luciae]
MHIDRISLENFRGYALLHWQPDPLINVITGGNAQGKTNLLEAIFFGFTGHSFRTSRDREMIRWGSSFCRVEINFRSGQQENSTVIFLTAEGKKQRKPLNTNTGRVTDPVLLPVVFTPDHLLMIKGSPAVRRRWLDQELGPLQAGYLACFRRYQQVLAQRNNLLQRIRVKQRTRQELEPWNQQLVAFGAKIIAWRCRLLAELSPIVREIYGQIGGRDEKAGLSYLSSLPLERPMGETEICERFMGELSRRYDEEVTRGQTLIGPHRDDLGTTINGQDVRRFGSQGQQRTMVLALKLAQLELGRRFAGDYPVILLDDVFSELDQYRRQQLVEHIRKKTQVFVTTSQSAGWDIAGLSGRLITVREHVLHEGG